MPDRQTELHIMLRTLRLPAIAALFEDLALKAAKGNLTHEAFLYELVRAECTQREEHRIARLLRLSGLPPDKIFRTLQLDRFPPLIHEQLERLRSGAFLEDSVNLVAAGKPGVGKSHALAAIGHELVAQGHQVLWTPTATLVQELLAAKRDLRRAIRTAECGHFDKSRLFGLERIFKDPMTTMAAIDRVVHHSVILDLMNMDSYRAKQASDHHARNGATSRASAAASKEDAMRRGDRVRTSPFRWDIESNIARRIHRVSR